jgi:hypothetical protein
VRLRLVSLSIGTTSFYRECETHAPLSWESEPPPMLAHTPLPMSSSATLNPRICGISKLHVWSPNLQVSKAFLTHRTNRSMTRRRHAAMCAIPSLEWVKTREPRCPRYRCRTSLPGPSSVRLAGAAHWPQWPVLSEAAHHIGDITAPSWHHSVTESFVLPPY